MPKFEVTIQRTVTTVDQFKRVIEADNAFEATIAGRELAYDSDGNCPDDCAEGGHTDLGSFYVASVEPTDKELDDE